VLTGIGQRNGGTFPRGEAAEATHGSTQSREWMAAGHQIGSHNITILSLPAASETGA